MHSTRRMKTTKSIYRPKIRKKRHKSKSVGCTPVISVLDLQNINEVLRLHKTQRAEGKGAWKVVPKDSCEVYKNRRKRQAEDIRYEDKNDTKMRTTDSDNTNSDNKTKRRRADKKRRSSARKTKKRQRPKRRRNRSSISSITTSTTSCNSYSTSSEMDYE